MVVIDGIYRTNPIDTREEYLVNGLFPLHNLILYLSAHREYNSKMAIDYLNKYYDIDLYKHTHSLEKYFLTTINAYDEFLTENPYPDDFNKTSRDYFNNKGRSHYLKFVNWCGHLPNMDYLNMPVEMDVVHHIHPLVYGGTNELDNLIHICEFNHEVLHMNPLEHIKKYCHQAVDYLWYLHNPYMSDKNKKIYHKYNMKNIEDKSNQYKVDFYKSAIKEEMNELYNLFNDIKKCE